MKKIYMLFLFLPLLSYTFPFEFKVDKEYKGLYINASYKHGIVEKANRLVNSSLYDYTFGYIFTGSFSAETSIPVVPLSGVFEVEVLGIQNTLFPAEKTNAMHLNDNNEWTNTTNTIYPITDNGVKFALGLRLHKFNDKRFEPFTGIDFTFSSIAHVMSLEGDEVLVIDDEGISNYIVSPTNYTEKNTQSLYGIGFQFYGGTYIKFVSSFYGFFRAGVHIQRYSDGTRIRYDIRGNPINLSDISEDAIAYKLRHFFFNAGLSLKLPIKQGELKRKEDEEEIKMKDDFYDF